MIRFFTYSQYHGKVEPVGSDFIRVYQLIKYWPQAALYKYGEKPDVLIFSKVFMAQDYKWPKHLEAIKILDICDPMWLEGNAIVETCSAMDAITCPTEALANYIRQFHSNVKVIPDRFDLAVIPKPKSHRGKAKTVVWFGYSHNADALRPAIPLLEELKLNLLIISNDDPIINRFGLRDKEEYYTYKKYKEESIYEDLKQADFAILPDGLRPEDKFKSNNKTIKANLVGLPVAKTPEDVREFMSGSKRRSWLKHNYDIIASEYDVKKSVDDYMKLINEIKKSERKA